MRGDKPAKKDEPTATKVWRGIGALITLAAPALLVQLSARAVQQAVAGALNDSFRPLLQKARYDDALSEYIKAQIHSAALDRTLIIYLGISAFIALVGAVHRVWAHGGDTPALKSADFAGKCLALSAAMLALSGAWARFGDAGVSTYLPRNFDVALVVGLVVVAALWVCGYLLAKAKAES